TRLNSIERNPIIYLLEGLNIRLMKMEILKVGEKAILNIKPLKILANNWPCNLNNCNPWSLLEWFKKWATAGIGNNGQKMWHKLPNGRLNASNTLLKAKKTNGRRLAISLRDCKKTSTRA